MRHLHPILPLLSAAALLAGCSDPDDPTPAVEELPLSHEMIVLGEKLDDPYSLENVQAAVSSIYPTKAGRIALTATDIYVRFLPADEDEFDRLVSMGLHLSDHPLDYRIVQDGDYYHDPSLDEGQITWQYAVVKPTFVFPDDIRREILDECYIADTQTATRSDDIDWSLVEREAYRLSGNEGMLPPPTRADEAGVKPSGRLTIVDPSVSDEPQGLAGVMVSCNTFVKFGYAYTDADGYYEMDRAFTTDVHYRIVFQNENGFGIGLNKILVPASTSTMGTAGPEGVDLTVDPSSERKLWCRAVVNNAAYEYFDKCRESSFTIDTPPADTRIWIFQSMEDSATPMLQQGTLIDGTVLADFLGNYKELVKMFLPDIILGVKDLEEYSSIYAQTVHELAHASHFSQVGKDYWARYIFYVLSSFIRTGGRMYGLGEAEDAGYCEVGEMWGYYMQNRLYKDRYGEDSYTFGTSYWFYPHIFLYLDERGLDRGRIFQALKESVNNRNALQEELESLYPEFSTVIDQAFERYSN